MAPGGLMSLTLPPCDPWDAPVSPQNKDSPLLTPWLTKLTTRIQRWEEAFTPLFNAFPGTPGHFWHSGCIPRGSNGTVGTRGSRGRVRRGCKWVKCEASLLDPANEWVRSCVLLWEGERDATNALIWPFLPLSSPLSSLLGRRESRNGCYRGFGCNSNPCCGV